MSIQWSASAVGQQVCEDLRSDPTGVLAQDTIHACFGTKSFATLLKRAGALKRYIQWHKNYSLERGVHVEVFPLHEPDVWQYFRWLREARQRGAKGFTGPASFLETVRFTKITIDLKGADEILSSRRLQGFAAIEKREMGPTRQSPPLQLEHLQRLHSVLLHGDNIYDRLGAGCVLVCTYGRARWSDLRYIHHVEVESCRNGCLVLYTDEHKTSSVGQKKDQYLPLVIPCDGVTSEDWLRIFLELYETAGLNIRKVPLGPLLPAPKAGGGFCARPLLTPEASRWLKELLKGTTNWDTFRSHSMKATLLHWCARAGLDKEVRSVLGHHCSAVSGSEVVYSRQLQARPIRKLQMLLRLVRIGMSLDEIADGGGVAGVTPGPQTPAPLLGLHGMAMRTPVFPVAQHSVPAAHSVGPKPCPFRDPQGTLLEHPPEPDPIEQAIEVVQEQEDLISMKEELENLGDAALSAGDLSLFPERIVGLGLVEIESSSGSSSSSSSTSSDEPLQDGLTEAPTFVEHVPEGVTFFKHVKSHRVHSVRTNQDLTACKLKVTRNFKALERIIYFKHPKCLRCFPKAPGRVRSREDAVAALDEALERVRRSKKVD